MMIVIEEGKCRDCGRMLPIGIYLCRTCKEKAMKKIKCKKCGKEICWMEGVPICNDCKGK